MSPKTLPKKGRPRPRRATEHRPSYPTFFRVMILPGEARDIFRRELSTPVERLRARAEVARIDAASLDALIAMSGTVKSYARQRLKERLIEAPEALLAALDELFGREYPRTVDDATEARLAFLLEPLAELGEAGGALLARHIVGLPEPTQVLAAVVLGLTGQRQMAPTLLDLARRFRRDWPEEHVVGPLWGLVDLEAPEVEALLLEMLAARQIVPELYGFLARVGGEEALAPLLGHFLDQLFRSDPDKGVVEEILTATAGVVHRIGMEASRGIIEEALSDHSNRDEHVQALLSSFESRPPSHVRSFFEITFAGSAPEKEN